MTILNKQVSHTSNAGAARVTTYGTDVVPASVPVSPGGVAKVVTLNAIETVINLSGANATVNGYTIPAGIWRFARDAYVSLPITPVSTTGAIGVANCIVVYTGFVTETNA